MFNRSTMIALLLAAVCAFSIVAGKPDEPATGSGDTTDGQSPDTEANGVQPGSQSALADAGLLASTTIASTRKVLQGATAGLNPTTENTDGPAPGSGDTSNGSSTGGSGSVTPAELLAYDTTSGLRNDLTQAVGAI